MAPLGASAFTSTSPTVRLGSSTPWNRPVPLMNPPAVRNRFTSALLLASWTVWRFRSVRWGFYVLERNRNHPSGREAEARQERGTAVGQQGNAMVAYDVDRDHKERKAAGGQALSMAVGAAQRGE